MYARVARWEDNDPEQVADMAERTKAAPGPPPGVPATGFMLLADDESRRSIAIALFETEEDLRTGHEVLNDMNPDDEYQGRRTAVEFYKVEVNLQKP